LSSASERECSRPFGFYPKGFGSEPLIETIRELGAPMGHFAL
jgi:hypothetical protein